MSRFLSCSFPLDTLFVTQVVDVYSHVGFLLSRYSSHSQLMSLVTLFATQVVDVYRQTLFPSVTLFVTPCHASCHVIRHAVSRRLRSRYYSHGSHSVTLFVTLSTVVTQLSLASIRRGSACKSVQSSFSRSFSRSEVAVQPPRESQMFVVEGGVFFVLGKKKKSSSSSSSLVRSVFVPKRGKRSIDRQLVVYNS